MKQVIEKIKEVIEDCKKKRVMFHMPVLNNSQDLNVVMKELEPIGAILYHCQYVISFGGGDKILIDYSSKDKSRTFQNNPDRSVIVVTCSDSSLNFTDGWDEGI